MADTVIELRPTDLASAANVSVAYASQLLNGHRTPSLKLANAIEEVLGVPTTYWPRPEQPKVKRARRREAA